MKIPASFKNFIQPILTLVLVGLLIIFLFQFLGNENKSTNLQEIGKDLTFEEAANNFEKGNFEVYTRGMLIRKEGSGSVLEGLKASTPSPTVTPSSTTIKAVENSYDDLFFYVVKGEVKRLDIKTYGMNESILFNANKEIVNVSNNARQYTIYPIPSESDTAAYLAYQAYYNVVQYYFPIIPLIKDYREGKFNPVLRSANTYTGKWKHYLYTGDDVIDVVIQTEPETGLFRNFIVAHSYTETPTQIYFDFKKIEGDIEVDKIPDTYKKVDPVKTN